MNGVVLCLVTLLVILDPVGGLKFHQCCPQAMHSFPTSPLFTHTHAYAHDDTLIKQYCMLCQKYVYS